jgi:uncharacterized protein YbjQ (UPF0145 family)
MILVNTDFISGQELETIELVKGSTIQSKHLEKIFFKHSNLLLEEKFKVITK